MGKVFSLFRRKKEAPLDEAEAQLKDLNAEVAREEERRNKLVAARRRAMFMLVLWGLPLMLAGIGWGGAAFHFDWWNGDLGFYHFLPALLAPFLYISRYILSSLASP